ARERSARSPMIEEPAGPPADVSTAAAESAPSGTAPTTQPTAQDPAVERPRGGSHRKRRPVKAPKQPKQPKQLKQAEQPKQSEQDRPTSAQDAPAPPGAAAPSAQAV